MQKLLRSGSQLLLTGLVVTGLLIVFGLLMPSTPPVREPIDASTLNIPYTFSAGQTIYASQMNGNFTAIRNVVNALDDANISNGGITASAKLADLSISTGKLADGAVTSLKIADGTVSSTDIADGTVASIDITNGTVASVDIATAGVQKVNIYGQGTAATGDLISYDGTDLKFSGGDRCVNWLQGWTALGSAGTLYVDWWASVGSAAPAYSITDVSETKVMSTQAPTALKLTRLHAKASALLAASSSSVYTVRVNGVDTAMTVTVNDSIQEATDSTHTVTVVAGDKITLKQVITGTVGVSKEVNFQVCTTPYY